MGPTCCVCCAKRYSQEPWAQGDHVLEDARVHSGFVPMSGRLAIGRNTLAQTNNPNPTRRSLDGPRRVELQRRVNNALWLRSKTAQVNYNIYEPSIR